MSDLYWEIEKIIENPYTKIRIYFHDKYMSMPFAIDGFMIDDTFPLSSSATYSPLMEEGLIPTMMGGIGGMLGKLPGVGTALDALAKAAPGAMGVGPKMVPETIKKWDGTEAPEFSVGLLFIAREPSDHPEIKSAILTSKTMPQSNGMIYKAPMGYVPINAMAEATTDGFNFNKGVSFSSTLEGTCELSVGKWFSAWGLLLASSDFEASKECIENGSPLYVTGKATFTTYKDITFEEYLKFFKFINSEPLILNQVDLLADLKESGQKVKRLGENLIGVITNTINKM
jgi:hypothetical protein